MSNARLKYFDFTILHRIFKADVYSVIPENDSSYLFCSATFSKNADRCINSDQLAATSSIQLSVSKAHDKVDRNQVPDLKPRLRILLKL